MRTWLILACLFFYASPLLGADAPNDSPDEAEARKTAERFLMVLERNPRKGTALDKVVAFHLDHGSLNELVSQLREKAQSLTDDKSEESGRAWLVVGLIDDSRAETESAVEAFQQAERLLPKSSVASYSLGQALISLNRLADGAAALERAIQRQPVPTDLLEVFQSLGRVQQRLAPGDKIVEVWDRLEKLVPNDPRVPELIARTLFDDGHWEAALPRYESLAKLAKDPYRQSELELEVLDLRLKLGQTERALADSDRLLNNLKPEHWLFRETRRRVEEAFLAQDDVAGWIKHLEARLAAQPGDIDAVVRLSRAFAGLNRNDEARSRLEAAIKVAPNSPDLRLELIELLESQQKFAEAIAQYEALDRIAPNNPDHVREWGLLVIKTDQFVVPPLGGQSTERPDSSEDRLKAELRTAVKIWRKLVEAKPKDAVVAAQVADWLASADKSLLGDAADLLRKAVELEPDSLSHREQLGEVLATSGQKDESLAAWRSMADGPRRTANNLAHLAEVLSRFGYRDETLTTIVSACELDRKSLELRFQQAELRRNWKQFESAMSALAEAAKLADTPETFDRVVQVEVRMLSESEMLTERIEELKANAERGIRNAELDNSALRTPHSALQHFRLARYLEAADKLRDATVAARKAVELDPKNGIFLQAAAKMLAADSQWLSAVEVYERLLKLDRRFRIDSLRAIAEMEQKLGRKDRALKAGRDLLAAAPANPEAAEFVVDLCVHFGQPTDALQILRRASRQNSADRKLAMKLVDRLMDSPAVSPAAASQTAGGRNSANGSRPSALGRTNALNAAFEEAREVLWRVFEKSNKSDDRAEVAKKLGELSVLPGEFAKLIARLERLRFERKMSRDASLALVNVHEQAGDTLQARRELDRLLPQAPRDTDLLKRMVALCESTGDLNAAITHQQRLADITRRRETDEHLIVLLRRAGRDDKAKALTTKSLDSERDPAKLLREIHRLLTVGQAKVFKDPNNADFKMALRLAEMWLVREPQNWEFAFQRMTALSNLRRATDADVAISKLLALPISDDELSLFASRPASGLLTDKIASRVRQIRDRMSMGVPPNDFGAARFQAISFRGQEQPVARSNSATTSDPRATSASQSDRATFEHRETWDDVYRAYLAHSQDGLIQAIMKLLDAVPDDAGAQWLALSAIARIRQTDKDIPTGNWRRLEGKDPLPSTVLDRLVAAFQKLRSSDEAVEWDGLPLLELLGQELVRARRADTLAELMSQSVHDTNSPDAVGWLIERAAWQNETDKVLEWLPRYAAVAEGKSALSRPLHVSAWRDPRRVASLVQHAMIPSNNATATAAKNNVLRVLDAGISGLSSPRLPHDLPARLSGRAKNLAEAWSVWANTSEMTIKPVEFPTPADMSGESFPQLVLQAFLLAQEQGWHGELLQSWRDKVAVAESGSRGEFVTKLGLASLLLWNGKTNDALPVARAVFDLNESKPVLRMAVARLHQNHDQQELALQLLDRIETLDNRLRKEIEQRALPLATKLNNTERVKLAAERLFGMKLEPDEELQLAATLSGLGLHEQAEAIRLRLPQRAGNNLLALQQLMDEHSTAERIDEACAVAEQIVRRTAPANPLIGSSQQATFSGGVQAKIITQHSVARTKALALLGRNGRLEPMIAQAEAQFERSQSLKLFGLLAELYAAADPLVVPPSGGAVPSRSDDPKQPPKGGTTNSAAERQAKLVVRLANSDAVDPQFRLTLARALVSAGQAKLAVPHFLFAIERLPNATAQVLFEAEQILSELGHVEELATIVLKSKLAVHDAQRIELFSRIVKRLEGPPPREKLIIRLFDKALREAPEFRQELSARLLMVEAPLSAQDEFFPILRDLAVPNESVKSPGPWFGVDVARLHGKREIDSITRRTVFLAESLKQLDDFAAHVEVARKRQPDWTLGGNITLGWVRLKQGKLAEAKELFNVAFRSAKERSFAEQKMTNRNFDLLVSGIALDLARAGDFDGAVSFYELTADTETVLEHCRWFGREPTMQRLAVRIVNRMLAKLDNADELSRQAGSPLFPEAAKIMTEINQPYSAARLLQAMITRWQLPGANNSDGGVWLRQLEDRFASARAAIKPETLVVRTPTSERPDVSVRATSGQAGEAEAAFDLLFHVAGDSLATLRLDSPFARKAKSDSTGANRENGGAANEANKSVWPTMSKLILTALNELANSDSKNVRAAVEQLLTQAKTEEKVARPRTAPPAFHPQLGLWLVARDCLQRDDLKQLGNELATIAAETASKHFDPRFRWAILRERGELALKSGDKPLAQRVWRELADDVLRARSPDETVPMLIGQRFVWPANWPRARMTLARELCQLTLIGDMPDVSLTIFRDAARGSNFAEDVLATWDDLEPEWRSKNVATASLLATLTECVLPIDRPNEIFVFTCHPAVVRTTGGQATGQPQSLALRLVELSVAEKQTEVLTKRLADRDQSATNPLAVRLVSLLLAQQTNDFARLTVELKKLEQHDWSKPADADGRIATLVVSQLMPLAESNKQISGLLEELVPQLAKANSRDEHPLSDLRRWLARRQLDQQQTDKAKETISVHLRHMDQVWSAAGAMDGQHLRRLELLNLAGDFATAGLTRDAIDLLAQVADARWPDKFPDENPGPVLAILESQLKSLTSQERYELWRNWTLPNDGLKSMRMLTGAVKSEIRNPKSEGNFKSQISTLKSTGLLLIEAAAEAKRLPELAVLVEQQRKQRPNDRLHVLLALIHLANEAPMSAEPFLQRQIAGSDSQGTRTSTTRTRAWDDWLLSHRSKHESLREISSQLAERARNNARELGDAILSAFASN